MQYLKRWATFGLLVLVSGGWLIREATWAAQASRAVSSATINLDQVTAVPITDKGEDLGKNGVYIAGDTPASSKFVTGRYTLPAGKSPHPPHSHAEEEVMIIESGRGEILCDGKTTKIGPGSVMFTTPNVVHGINNTGDEPIVFYYIKWESKK